MRMLLAVAPLVLLAAVLVPACSQQCPHSDGKEFSKPSSPRTLEGTLVYHDGIRKWFELKLDQPHCGQPSIQLTPAGDDWTALEVLRSCRVRSKGVLDLSPTGYYSLDTYQAVEKIEPIEPCTRQPPIPAEPKSKPDPKIRAYRVDMHVDYSPGDHPIQFRATSAGRDLRPWQAYASYFLTGGFVLYGRCGEGFVVDRVFGPPQASPQHSTERGDPSDQATYDPESASTSGITDLHLSYTCVRTLPRSRTPSAAHPPARP